MSTKGFGYLGLLITVALMGIMAYYMLQSFKQETHALVPGTATGTTPIQAAETAKLKVESNTQVLNSAIKQAQKIAH